MPMITVDACVRPAVRRKCAWRLPVALPIIRMPIVHRGGLGTLVPMLNPLAPLAAVADVGAAGEEMVHRTVLLLSS
jgi:hypothetical protein